MNKNYLLVSVLFLMQVFSLSAQDNIDPSEIADESTRLFAGGELDDFNKAFSGPNNTTNFPSETLFSLSDIGRKTYHMYRSTNYRLTRLANYQPLPASTATNEALSSPMLKITGSSITVDLNGFHVSRQTTDVDGNTTVNAVGIEIGYSPYDAAQGKFGLASGATFATVSQPENVTIRNGRIDNFGIGIVIHAGVKNVTLENLTISNAALGVVCAGQADKPAVSIFLKNVRIESDGTDKSAVLAWAKSKLESNTVNVGYMNYGDNNVMPEQVDPVLGTSILNVYSGILLVNTNNVSVYDVGCTNLGYARCVDEDATAEGTASATFGINAIGCTSLQLEKVDASNNCSLRLVSGINISGCSAVTMTDVVATNSHIVVRQENDYSGPSGLTPTTTFGLWARGVSILSSNAVTIDGLQVSRTLGAASVGVGAATNRSTAMGLYLSSVNVLNAKNLQSDYNNSEMTTAGLTFGVYATGLLSGSFDGVSASYNTGGASTDINQDTGSIVGMYFAGTCTDLTIKNASCDNNFASTRYAAVRGIAAATSGIYSTWTFENVSACNNTHADANADQDAAGIYLGSAVTNLTLKNVHADKNGKTSTGGNGYGIYTEAIIKGTFDYVTCDNNTSGVATRGLNMNGNVADVMIDHSSFSVNTGNSGRSVRGISFGGTATDVVIKNSRIDGNDGSTSSTNAGIYVAGVATNFVVDGCSISNNTATTDTIAGLWFTLAATNITIKNSRIDRTNSTSGVLSGVQFDAASTNITVDGCSITNTTASLNPTNVYGIGFTTAVNVINLKINNTTIDRVVNTSGANAYGVYIGGNTGNNGLTVTNSSLNNISAATIASGIYFSQYSLGVLVENCTLDGYNAATVTGMTCGDSKAVVLKNVSLSNHGRTTGTTVKGIDFLRASDGVQLENVNIVNNNGTTVYGMHFNGALTGLSATNCHCDELVGSGTAKGILFASTAKEVMLDTVSCNSLNSVITMGMHFTGQADNVQLQGVDMLGVIGTTGGTKGVYFQAAGNNVTIQDTNIVGLEGTTTNSVGAIFFDTTATNVKLNNVHANGTHSSTATVYGFVIDEAANNVEIKNSSFDNTYATLAGVVYGINIGTSVNDLTLENVTADYAHGTTATTVYGMYITAASGVHAQNISANNTSGVFARGIAFITSLKNAYIDGLQANGTTSSNASDTTNNLRIVAGDGVTLKNAQCNGLSHTDGTNISAYSIDFVTSAQNIVLENVESNNGLNSTHDMHGIYFGAAETVTLKNVSSSGHVSTDDNVYGINFGGTADTVVIKNAACNNNTGGGSAYGIYFDTSATDITIDGCNASGNTGTTYVGGISFASADSASLKNIIANNNGGSTISNIAIGIYCVGAANNVTLENVVASGNYGSGPALGAGGIFFANDSNAGFVFKNVVASNNTVTGVVDEGTTYTPGTYAFGIKLNSANSLVASDINCSYNVGPDATQTTNDSDAGDWNTVSSVGMWLVDPVAAQLGNVTCDYNGVGDEDTNAYVFGLLLDNPSSVTIDSISCSNNAGNALGAGLFANGGSSVSITNGLFNNNTSVAARVTTSAVISSGVNMSKHTTTPVLTVTDDDDDTFNNPQLLKGSYGIVMDSTYNVTLDTVTASQNTGFRAFGVQLRSCNGVQMKDCITNQQSATGDLFVGGTTIGGAAEDILDLGTNGSAVTIPIISNSTVTIVPDIFGTEITGITGTVNLQELVADVNESSYGFLDTVKLLKDAPDTPEIINNVITMYSYHKPFVEASMLARAIVAQVRAWGVAVGTQLNNCSDAVITNLIACGNNSDKDSAFGLIFANNCTDCKVYGGQFNNNEAWTDSALDVDAGTIDISQMNQFWSALDIDLPNSVSVDNVVGYVLNNSEDYGILHLVDADSTTGRFVAKLTDGSTKELCTPCGPIGAGIVIGDTSARVDISDVMCAGNKANAGQAYGLLHDVSVGASVQNSRFFQNMSNTCGIAFGLADFTPQSLSVHLGNTAFGNQYHLFMDSNYIVPFNPGEPYNMEFPTKVGYNGNITELANASVYDNIEIRFVYDAPADPRNLPDNVYADWTTLGFVTNDTTASQNGEVLYTLTDNGSTADIVINSMREAVADDATITLNPTWTLTITALTGYRDTIPASANEEPITVRGTGTITNGLGTTINVVLQGTIYFDVAADASSASLGGTTSTVDIMVGDVVISTIEVTVVTLDVVV